jgi:hypothetical protein
VFRLSLASFLYVFYVRPIERIYQLHDFLEVSSYWNYSVFNLFTVRHIISKSIWLVFNIFSTFDRSSASFYMFKHMTASVIWNRQIGDLVKKIFWRKKKINWRRCQQNWLLTSFKQLSKEKIIIGKNVTPPLSHWKRSEYNSILKLN